MSKCRCTPNSLCRAHRAVMELTAIAGDLRIAGWQQEADKIAKIALELLKQLTAGITIPF